LTHGGASERRPNSFVPGTVCQIWIEFPKKAHRRRFPSTNGRQDRAIAWAGRAAWSIVEHTSMMNHNWLVAAIVAALGFVCWPSPRWQRLLLAGMALLARVGVLGTLASLGVTAIWPEAAPGSLPTLVAAAAERNQLDPAFMCLALAGLVACGAVPLLAGLDFARSLADDRAVSRALRAALNVRKQYDATIDSAVMPTSLPSSIYRASAKSATDNRRRLGDIASS
jgi:hypothetical protein